MPLPLILLNLFLLCSILTEIVKNEQSRRLKFYLNKKKKRTDQTTDKCYDAHIAEIKTNLFSSYPICFAFYAV